MRKIAARIKDHINAYCVSEADKVDILDKSNSMVSVSYFGKKLIRQHCDQNYDKEGNFIEAANSQKRNTFTVILAVGDLRELEFVLNRRRQKGDRGTKPYVKIDGEDTKHMVPLPNGALFFLHPDDELPQIRKAFDNSNLTFYTHQGKGVSKGVKGNIFGDDLGMTIGLVFRICSSYKEVDLETGVRILSEAEQEAENRDKFEKNHQALEDFIKDVALKDSIDKKLGQCYKKIEKEHLK
jgi:hypothetical protein